MVKIQLDDFKENNGLSLKILNYQGQVVYTDELINASTLIDVSDFSAGLYVVQISDSQFLTSRKLVIN